MIIDFQISKNLKQLPRQKFVRSVGWKLLRLLLIILIIIGLGLEFIPGLSLSSSYMIISGLALIILWWSQYYQSSITIGAGPTDNLLDHVDESVLEYLLAARRLSEKRNNIIDEAILWLALNEVDAGRYLLIRTNCKSPDEYTNSLMKYWQGNPDDILATLAQLFSDTQGVISWQQFISRLLEHCQLWQEILKSKELSVKDGQSVIGWYERYVEMSQRPNFWTSERVEGGIGSDWSFGYAPVLRQYARDITIQVSGARAIRTFGRENEVLQLEQALLKSSGSNAILVGDNGIGKKTIVRELAQKIFQGKTNRNLWLKHIWDVDTGSILAGAGQKGEVESRIKGLFDDATLAGDVILLIDDFHSLVVRKEHTGAVNATEIIMPYLKDGGVQIVATTTFEQFHSDIESNPGLAESFEKIEVLEPKEEDVVYILEEAIPYYEGKYRVVFTFQAVKEIVKAASRYIHDKPFPSKAIDLVESVAINISNSGDKIITPQMVDAAVSIKANVPVGEAAKGEKERLLDLENVLHQRVIGQNEAISAVAAAMKRARSGLSRTNKPIGTFLFVGPTGVGKTETAKALAEAYFGDENRMIRLDMSEYQTPDSINKLIGSAPSGGESGNQGELTKAIKDSPFSVVLLDEIEKANANVLNVFLQVLDDGRLTDGVGRTVDFTNAIIIATSNAGAEILRQLIKQGAKYEDIKAKTLEYILSQKLFKPEFVNRFDAVVMYRSLTIDELLKVVDIMLERVIKRLTEQNITLQVSPLAKQKLAQLGYSPEFGARPLARTIQTKVEDPLAEKILKDQIQPGGTILIDEKDIV